MASSTAPRPRASSPICPTPAPTGASNSRSARLATTSPITARASRPNSRRGSTASKADLAARSKSPAAHFFTDIFKPHPSVYRLATDAFDCQPTQVAFISSNGWDVAGAAAFGFQTVWVNRRKAPREVLPATPHVEIHSLDALPELLPQ